MEERSPVGWAGIDVGKGHHWVCLIDEAGTTVWSAKVLNDEAAIFDAISCVLGRAKEVVWGVDVTGTMSGLLLALLAAHGQRVRYIPGRTVNQMASAYPVKPRPTPVTPMSSPRRCGIAATWPRWRSRPACDRAATAGDPSQRPGR